MKKLLFLLLLSSSVFGQNINLQNGETRTITEGTWNVTFAPNSHLIAENTVSIQNMNNFHNGAKFTVNGTAHLGSSVNLNGGGTLIVNGTLNSKSGEIQNGGNNLFIYGTWNITGDYQHNDASSILTVCGGKINVSNYTNFHSHIKTGAIKLCDCGVINTYGLNNNKEGSVEGKGDVIYQTGNISKPLGTYVSCNSLPVTIISSDIRIVEYKDGNVTREKLVYKLQISHDSNLQEFFLQVSDDQGVTWRPICKPIMFIPGKYSYSGELYEW